MIPVGFGLSAPSGVLMIGASLALRDYVQKTSGVTWALGAIGAGAVLSAFVATPALALASVAAFLISELADLAVYTPLAKRRLWLAVLASGLVGSVVDSAAFLFIAFGSLDFIAGQVLGKMWVAAAAALIAWGVTTNERVRP